MEYLQPILNFLKPSKTFWLAACIASIAFILLYDYLQGFGATQEMRFKVILVFLFSASMLFAICIFHVIEWLQVGLSRKKKYDVLRNLTPSEKEVLAKYIENETTIFDHSRMSRAVMALKKKKIIYEDRITMGPTHTMPMHIKTWAYNYLKKNSFQT